MVGISKMKAFLYKALTPPHPPSHLLELKKVFKFTPKMIYHIIFQVCREIIMLLFKPPPLKTQH